MKRLVWLSVLLMVGLLYSSFAVAGEEDYKRLYLEQKVKSLQIELQALPLRFTQVQDELFQTLAELREYNAGILALSGNNTDENITMRSATIPPEGEK